VIHRDLKPGNIMVTPDGLVKLLDFGLARPVQLKQDETTLTMEGDIAGTPAYMSPEQAEGKPTDARSDVFSFGAVLYQMLTGRRAFSGDSVASVLASVLREEPPPLGEKIPHDLEKVVARCLQKNPARRFQHMADVRIALEELKRESDSGEISAQPRRWGRGKSPRLGLGILVLVIAGILLALTATLAGLNVSGLRNRLWSDASWRNRVSPPRIEAIAVLPFENVSGDPTQEYFADGMTEELVTSLGRIGGLRVISRQSVMRFKGSRKPLPETARELNVDGIVEGTVGRAGNRVRITANLLHAATDRHLWANSHDSELENLFVVEGKVARAIAVAVRIELMPQEQLYFAGAHQVDPDAYLEGRYYLSQLTEEGFKNAVAHFREAIDLDPAYARAYEGLAEVHSFVGMWGLKPATQTFPLAKAAALKALELDDGLADAHAALGLVNLVFDGDWSGADRSLKRAVTLNPNSFTAHFYYGLFLTAMG
jgi:TolB-like protein